VIGCRPQGAVDCAINVVSEQRGEEIASYGTHERSAQDCCTSSIAPNSNVSKVARLNTFETVRLLAKELLVTWTAFDLYYSEPHHVLLYPPHSTWHISLRGTCKRCCTLWFIQVNVKNRGNRLYVWSIIGLLCWFFYVKSWNLIENCFFSHNSEADCPILVKFCVRKQNRMLPEVTWIDSKFWKLKAETAAI